MSKALENQVAYKSPLHEMTQTTPTCLWNDSAALSELTYSIEHGAVGATCNPVIVLDVLKKEAHLWNDRIRAMATELPTATEEEIWWKLVEEISAQRAELLRPGVCLCVKGPCGCVAKGAAETAGCPFKPIHITIATLPPCWSKRCVSMPWRRI